MSKSPQQKKQSSDKNGRDGNVRQLFKEAPDCGTSPSDTVTYREEFTRYFGGRVARQAAAGKWTKETGQLAIDYVKQLVQPTSASVTVPEGLKNQVVITAIHTYFMLSCTDMDTPAGTFAGQSEPWFKHTKRITPAVMPQRKLVSQAS
jgi:hypothetical protein